MESYKIKEITMEELLEAMDLMPDEQDYVVWFAEGDRKDSDSK